MADRRSPVTFEQFAGSQISVGVYVSAAERLNGDRLRRRFDRRTGHFGCKTRQSALSIRVALLRRKPPILFDLVDTIKPITSISPFAKARAQPRLDLTVVSPRWGLGEKKARTFSFRSRCPCGVDDDALYTHASSFGRTTWPRRAQCVGLTTSLQFSINRPAGANARPNQTRIERSVI